MQQNIYPQGPFIVTPSLEQWPTKAKEATSRWTPLTQLDTNPVFQCLR